MSKQFDNWPGFGIGRPTILSRVSSMIWAKTNPRDPSDTSYLRLWQHLEDTAETARLLWRHFIPDHVKDVLSADIGSTEEAGRLLCFLAAIHDVGKASPAFEMMSPTMATTLQHQGLPIDFRYQGSPERSRMRHELVGFAAVQDWMAMRFDADIAPGGFAESIAAIVAGHHGTAIDEGKRTTLRKDTLEQRYLAGDCDWKNIRFEYLDWAMRSSGARDLLASLVDKPLRQRSQILLTSCVILADWIASNTDLFPLSAYEGDEMMFDAEARAHDAWSRLDLPRPWAPPNIEISDEELFQDRFAIPGARLRPVQRDIVELARNTADPGLIILEANMGEGKTEAALMAAEILAVRFNLNGVFYALPTQATVNAMFTRFITWMKRLPEGSRPEAASVFLSHSKRDLNEDYRGIKYGRDSAEQEAENAPSNVDIGDTTGKDGLRMRAMVNSWLSGRKRGNLANFVVGTIDQVLIAGLRSKHVVLRHLALAGKVVILDEIHSNSAYMNVFMETVLAWFGYYRIPVIMLSATLPQSTREQFLSDYESGFATIEGAEGLKDGRNEENDESHDSWELKFDDELKPQQAEHGQQNPIDAAREGQNNIDFRYPLISSTSELDGRSTTASKTSGRDSTVHVSLLNDDDGTLVSLLQNKLRDGGCAVVVRDTVRRAQHTYDLLRQRLDTPVMMMHSRFLAMDRARIERDLVHRFGPHGAPSQRRGVVVATQVVEQSLDVDFDLMVSDIAPVDLVLQRSGRLHRHHRGEGESDRPSRVRQPWLFITGVTDWSGDEIPIIDQTISMVYPSYVLHRTLAVLGIEPGRDAMLHIPNDIPRLVQSVYGSVELCPAPWRETVEKEREQWRRKLEDKQSIGAEFNIRQPDRKPFVLDNWLSSPLEDPENPSKDDTGTISAGVRDGEDSFEVIVLEKTSQGLRLPDWGGFSSGMLPNGQGLPNSKQVFDILTCTIPLGSSALGEYGPSAVNAMIAAIETSEPPQWMDWQGEKDLSGQLLIALDADGRCGFTITIGKKRQHVIFEYTPAIGWRRIQ